MLSVCLISFLIVQTALTETNDNIIFEDMLCSTPELKIGHCVEFRECRHILNFLNESMAFDRLDEAKSALKGYYCKRRQNEPLKLCCPYAPMPSLGQASVPIRSVPVQKQQISTHVNFGLLPSNCGYSDAGIRITGGDIAELFHYPWMALLAYQIGTGRNFLLGVRVGEHNISSQEDCLDVGFGTLSCSPPIQDFLIGNVIPHPDYNSTTFHNDIALIKLKTSIDFNDNAKAICLPNNDYLDFNYTDKIVTVSGWGVTEDGHTSEVLRKIDVPIMNHEQCQLRYERVKKINTKQFCINGDVKDSCKGDSGGPAQIPAVVNGDSIHVQLGIVSFGGKLCGAGSLPSVYTKVFDHTMWILDNLSN